MKQSEKDSREVLGLRDAGEGNKNYSVKAGAGGGKTTLLSRRISRQILLGTPIEEFVVITYTNAAATELREKITKQLQKMLTDSITVEESENVAKALNSIELMQISTIHSFLFRILRENAFEAGIVLDAKMLEEQEDIDRKQKFFDEWYRDPIHFSEIMEYADDWNIEGKTTHTVQDHTHEVFNNMFFQLANVREEIVYDTSDQAGLLEFRAKSYIDRWLMLLTDVKTAMESNSVKPDKKVRSYKKKSGTVFSNVAAVLATSNRGDAEAILVSEALAAIKEIVKTEDNIYSHCKETFTDIDSSMNRIVEEINKYSIEFEWNYQSYKEMAEKAQKASKVVEYVIKMQKEYQKMIDEETLVLSNDDILYRAERLLSNNSFILDKVRKQYSKVYVDEFQDTTGLQTKIVKLITENPGTKLEDNDYTEDKLLVVGDPKQSIYRFTGAEKAVYDDMDALINSLPDEISESVLLETNFRSNSDIIDWVNKSFSKVMPGYTAMDTDWKVGNQKALHGVYKHCEVEGYTKEQDVEAVTKLVKTLVNNPKFFVEEPVRNNDGSFGAPVLRNIEYSDIMIISKYTTNMERFVESFSKEGIPVNVQGKFKIDKDEILHNFVILADYFAGYKNKKKRIAAEQVIQSLDATAVDDTTLKIAKTQLDTLRAFFRDSKMNSQAILQYLLVHEELYVPKDKQLPVERVRAYRIRLHQMVESCMSKCNGDMRSIADQLAIYLTNDVRREIPLESNENAIRLMNVHQSKGLTAQIVIIADRSSSEGCRYSEFRKTGKFYPVASFKTNPGSVQASSVTYPSYGADIDLLKIAYKDETEEAVRLQYVAATRGAHALILMPAITKEVWFSNAGYNYDQLEEITEYISKRMADTNDFIFTNKTSQARHNTICLENLNTNISMADLSAMTQKLNESITPSGLEPDGVTGFSYGEIGYDKENRPGANVFGTVMHRVYQLLFERYAAISEYDMAKRDKAIKRAVNQAILESQEDMRAEDKPSEFSDYLNEKMKIYFNSVLTPIMESAEEVYTEYTFSFYVSDEEKSEFISMFDKYLKNAKTEIVITDEKIWVNGQADLVVRQKDGRIKVYDYKSDAMNGKNILDFEAALAKKYEGQLALYRYAIGKAFGVDNVETELIHLYR